MRLPKKTDEQKSVRDLAILQATKVSASVPLRVMEACLEVVKLSARMAIIGNQNSLSDAGVGILMARAGLEGAAMNVLISLQGLGDPSFVTDMQEKVAALRSEMTQIAEENLAAIFSSLRK